MLLMLEKKASALQGIVLSESYRVMFARITFYLSRYVLRLCNFE